LFVRLKAFLVVLILGLFIVVTFFTGIALSGIRKFIAERVADYPSVAEYVGDILLNDSLWYWLQFGVGYGLNVIFFTITYRLFSLRRTSWWECLKGGLLSGFLWELGRYALTLYLLRGGYSAYGVIGSFIGIMLWFYYAWTVLFFGAEFVQVSHRMRVARQAAHSAAEKAAPAQPPDEKQK
jgi:membrane protein